MTLDDFLNHIEAGGALNTPEIYRLMDEMSDEARRVTCEINNSYHSQEELRAFMSRLTGKPVDETFKMFLLRSTQTSARILPSGVVSLSMPVATSRIMAV